MQFFKFLANSSVLFLFIFCVCMHYYFLTGILALNPVSFNHCYTVFTEIAMPEVFPMSLLCSELTSKQILNQNFVIKQSSVLYEQKACASPISHQFELFIEAINKRL